MIRFPRLEECIDVCRRVGVVTVFRVWVRHGVVFERFYRSFCLSFSAGGGDGVRALTFSAGGDGVRLVLLGDCRCLGSKGISSIGFPTHRPLDRPGYRGCSCN